MPNRGPGLRPDIETFECAGCRVTVVGGAEILALAEAERVELVHDATFPAPVREVGLAITAGSLDDQRVYLLDATIRTGVGDRPEPRPKLAVLGNDPIGVLLARRVARDDDWATRLVDGVGTAVTEVSRRLGLDRPIQAAATTERGEPVRTSIRDDEGTGLRAMVTYREHPSGSSGRSDGHKVEFRATVARDVMSSRHLAALFGIVLQVVGDLADAGAGGSGGADALAGGAYVLARYPMAGSSASDATEDVSLDQVGGLDSVVAQFRQIAVSFRHPDVMARWGARRPQGILMYGPPGTGKTMLARALANEIGARFRQIRSTEILDKWLGGSERNIKRIFRNARRYREPTVMLFDEFDSIISYVGGGLDAASQAVNAVAGIFKQEMNDLIEANPNVIVVATTNFPERVDESLTRSGRFDIKLAIPVPDQTGRAQIITKMIRQLIARHEVSGFRMFADDLDPQALAAASEGMTGADIKEALRRARLAKAMQEARTGIPATPIGQHDLEACIGELRRAAATG